MVTAKINGNATADINAFIQLSIDFINSDSTSSIVGSSSFKKWIKLREKSEINSQWKISAQMAEKKESQRYMAVKYGISKTQVQQILPNKENLKENVKSGCKTNVLTTFEQKLLNKRNLVICNDLVQLFNQSISMIMSM